ncbi:MAG: metal-dependent hydrolase, partial [Acidiferrobacterales bacterium]|nr:metal-dependent hydrolase [Acidiferrobacterales bacterium]
MDPLTQGVVGATASQVVATRKEKFLAALLGFFSGLAPDLDVLISSDTDPLLALEYHRHFTHSLIFIPFGALICAGVFYYLIPYFRAKLTFKQTYLFCFAGYVTHAALDACTTYGTQLFWPFSSARVAWNTVSVIDPLFTLPLIVLLLFSVFKRSNKSAVIAVIYAFTYLSLGFVQNHRAESLAMDLAQSRGHTPINLGVKPSMANLVTWKSVYEYQGRYYVDAVRVLKTNRIIEGSSTEKLDIKKHFPWLNPDSQQAKDIERFSWFSNHHLGVDPYNKNRIIDIRYSLLPNELTGMWGITLDQLAKPDEHVVWTTTRPNRDNVP